MTLPTPFAAALSIATLVAGTTLVAAQDYDRPPAGYGDEGADYGRAAPDYDRSAPVDRPDPASLAVRVSKLEGRIREMTGQIEELQNTNRKLVDQLQKFQTDVEARLSGGGGRQKRSEAEIPSAASERASTPAATEGRSRTARRDDSFDPDAAASDAPGRPKPLGSRTEADNGGGNTPMDLSGGKLRRDATGDADTIAPTLRLPSPAARPAAASGATTTPNGTVIASTGQSAGAASTPRAEYEVALGYYKDKQYESAEKSFTDFLQKNPKNRYAPDATFYLGETYAKRGRSREAAEQYLKISTDYSSAPRAPDAMLHLGMSLKALGAKEQACATFSEVTRKYPNAPDYVRNGAEREAKRSQC